MAIIASATPAGSLAHNPSLNSSASRQKAVRDDIVLSIDNVRPTDLVIVNLSQLTSRAAANTVDCIRLQEFRAGGHCDGDHGDTWPITEKSSTVSEGIETREI